MRRFAILGQRANADGSYLLDDVPGTSGRLDVLLRCIRAAMLASHGLRGGVVVYLVLGGGPRAPRVVRLESATIKFLRPDERALAVLMKKVLVLDDTGPSFVTVRPGIALASGGLATVLDDVGDARVLVLEEGAPDIRETSLAGDDLLFVLGDHLGITPADRALLELAQAVGIGPLSIHADDAVAVVSNELDRYEGRCRP